jgi:DcuC family C4-dicarboxylate transporter
MDPILFAAGAVIAAAVWAVAKGVDVRLVLLAAAIALAGLKGDLSVVVREFLGTISNEKFVIPICTAMGFAYVLRKSECDQHLVRLLMAPVSKVRWLLVPGVIVVGFLVNVPVISQTSTAVCLGPVVVPLMRAAGYSPAAIGSTLLLGCSVGGELLNPGAPELLTVSALTKYDTRKLVEYLVPLVFPMVAVAALIFWTWVPSPVKPDGSGAEEFAAMIGTINPLKALVPLVPIVLLFLSGPPLDLIHVPQRWLVPYPPADASAAVAGGSAAYAGEHKSDTRANSRLIGLAMLVGVAVAAGVSPKHARGSVKEFFDGAGYGFTHIISLIVTANCFGKAIEHVGLAEALGELIKQYPHSLVPLAGAVPCAFAAVSGSGMASTQSLYGFFHGPAVDLGYDPAAVGAVVSLASAAGRTMSPVAAVTLMCCTLTGAKPFELTRRVAPPLVIGLVVVVGLRATNVI